MTAVTREYGKFCRGCAEDYGLCCVRGLLGEPRCCDACRHDVESRITSPATAPAEPPQPPGIPMSRADEDRVVASLLRRAADVDAGGPELYGEATLDAYKSLARSRGADLEFVLRSACRNELADVVRRPAAPG